MTSGENFMNQCSYLGSVTFTRTVVYHGSALIPLRSAKHQRRRRSMAQGARGAASHVECCGNRLNAAAACSQWAAVAAAAEAEAEAEAG